MGSPTGFPQRFSYSIFNLVSLMEALLTLEYSPADKNQRRYPKMYEFLNSIQPRYCLIRSFEFASQSTLNRADSSANLNLIAARPEFARPEFGGERRFAG